MATIPDVPLAKAGYKDLYEATGIPVGTSVTIQNKSIAPVFLQNTDTQPTANSMDGFLLGSMEMISLTGTITGLWAIGDGRVSVEVIT